MAAAICLGCDYYHPKNYNVIGRECSAFIQCTEVEECGLRTPPLQRDQNGARIVSTTAKHRTEGIGCVGSNAG